MATEASLTDQAPDKQAEEMKVDDDIKHVDGESISVSENVEDEGENIKEDLASAETPVTETEDTKLNTSIEEAKKEEAKEGEITEKESESTDLEKAMENSEAFLVQVSEAEAEKDPTVSEAVAEEAEIKEPPPDSVTEAAEIKDPPHSVTEAAEVREPPPHSVTEEAEIREPPPDSVTEEAETKEPPPDSVTEEVKTKELPPASETEDMATEAPISTAVEPAPEVIVAPDARESAEISQDDKISARVEPSPDPSNEEPASQETPVEETAALDSSNSVAVYTTEVSEVQDNVAVSPEVPDASEKAYDIPNADIVESEKEETSGAKTLEKEPIEVEKNEESPVEEGKIVSERTKPEPAAEISEPLSEGVVVETEENTGNSLEGVKTTFVETSKDPDAAIRVSEIPPEEKNASGDNEEAEEKSLEGDKPALIDTSRDIDLDSTSKETTSNTKETESQVKPAEATQTLSDELVNEGLEDSKDENKEANDAKDGSNTKTEGEAPKQEAPTKSTQRQSNNILSKVKQSIVKVKKAIIGKSASSKTMTAEDKDEIKVK